MIALSDAESIADHCLSGTKPNAVQIGQTLLRISLLNSWNYVKPGFRILELGCGQGDMTAVLATAVGEKGHVVGVDPADPENYGSPYTLKQAQDHLKSSKTIGDRMTFVMADPLMYIPNTDQVFDAVVMSQCSWYFATPQVVEDTFKAIKAMPGSPKLLLSEFSLRTSLLEGMPHMHAVFCQAALEAFKKVTTSNIRTVLSPAAIEGLANKSGWKVGTQEYITPEPSYLDGKWEVGAVLEDKFEEAIAREVKDDRQRAVVQALRDAVISSVNLVGRKNIRCMDVWACVFE